MRKQCRTYGLIMFIILSILSVGMILIIPGLTGVYIGLGILGFTIFIDAMYVISSYFLPDEHN